MKRDYLEGISGEEVLIQNRFDRSTLTVSEQSIIAEKYIIRNIVQTWFLWISSAMPPSFPGWEQAYLIDYSINILYMKLPAELLYIFTGRNWRGGPVVVLRSQKPGRNADRFGAATKQRKCKGGKRVRWHVSHKCWHFEIFPIWITREAMMPSCDFSHSTTFIARVLTTDRNREIPKKWSFPASFWFTTGLGALPAEPIPRALLRKVKARAPRGAVSNGTIIKN